MDASRDRRRRAAAFALVLIIVFAFGIKLFDIQVVKAAELNEAATGKRSVPVTISSVRGDIVDRNGEIFASTDQRYDVQLSPKNVGPYFPPLKEGERSTPKVSVTEALTAIGEITGQSAEEIQQIIDDALAVNKLSDFAYVKRSVDLSALNALKALRVPWLTFEQNPSRIYPNGGVAGNLVGFVGSENEAQSGIELSQDQCLTGVDGSETYERGADGVPLPGSTVVKQPVIDGGTVRTTIDLDLQFQVQQMIDRQTANVGAEWGLAVVMDAKTGELVAVGEDGSVDPNNVDGVDSSRHGARSFAAPYEPGSTFKTFTAAALIDAGKATPDSPMLTPDSRNTEDGASFRDSFFHGANPYTLTGILVDSSNVGTTLLGERLNNQSRYDSLRKFGFGTSTEAGMPLEDSGMLAKPENWDVQTQYTTMFGQGLSSTIVQTAGGYQAIANAGLRVPPTLVSGCTDADGTEHPRTGGKPVRAVSAEAAAETMHMLEAVVEESWVKPFVEIPGYRIAGKTGTAEQGDGQGGYRSSFVHSFAGVFPADAPRYVAVVSIAHPSGGDGGVAALNGFREAAEATIKAFQIPPSTGSYQPLATTYE